MRDNRETTTAMDGGGHATTSATIAACKEPRLIATGDGLRLDHGVRGGVVRAVLSCGVY